VGIMQILPSTAAGPAVDIADVSTAENNIHAGVKYLAHLRDAYFNDPEIEREERVDFTFAAYNAGPARINSLRRRAAKEGLDPNRWNRNVEYVARKVIGRETDQYVANIHMYYVAYQTSLRMIRTRENVVESIR
jgi:membrane-bound lytic murein transglycosylase MltF